MGAVVRRGSAVAVAALAAAVMWAGVAAAAVYEVGDKAGWTIMGNPNYGAWAASKKFHFGDTVVFTYNKQFHNVMAVRKADYKNCDATKPIATWTTGKDSVVLNTTGHHYFLCGIPGHCGIGQKVDIRVATVSPSAAPSMAPAPASGSEPAGGGGSSAGGAAAAPSPRGNAASTVGCSIAMAVLSVAAAGLSFL